MIYKESPPDHYSREGFVHIQKSYFNLNNNPRLQLHRKPIIPHNNLLKPTPSKALVKLGKLGILLLDELIQLVDTLDLFVTDGGVGEVLLLHLTKPEYLIGDVVVVLLAGSVVDKLLLKFSQPLVYLQSLLIFIPTKYLCKVVPESFLIGASAAEHFIECLHDHIFQHFFVYRTGVANHTSRLQTAKAAPDDRPAAMIVPVNTAKQLAALPADYHLRKNMVTAETVFSPIRTDLYKPAANKFVLHPQMPTRDFG